ncbi:MAG: AAA family ATPase, partial [Anaerovoracaceae bacterium]
MSTSTKEKVREFQLGQLSHFEEEQFESVVKRAKSNSGKVVSLDLEGTVEEVRKAVETLYERESVLKQDKILAEVLNRNLGKMDLRVLREAVKDVSELRKLGGDDANPYYAPEVVIERELSAITSVEEQQGIFAEIAPEFKAFAGDESRKKQGDLVHGLLSSGDRFNLFRGVAGAGKTSTLQEFCKGLRSGGVENIYLIAPTNSATDVLKQEGFERSQTAASFLLSKEKPPAKSYVIIDESGLNSLREGVEIMKLARRNDYRVLFVGDARQHTAVESGDFFRLLEDYSKIRKFTLDEIHRQQNEEYRRGIFECAMGQYEEAFERFEKQQFIHEGKAAYLEEAAVKYMEFTEQGRFLDRAILVSPTHEECDKLTATVRAKLKGTEAIRGIGREMEVFRSWNKPKAWLKEASNFQVGMTIGFIRNMKGVGKAGEVASVEAVEGRQLVLDNGKRIFAKGASDFIDVGELRSIELCEGDLIQFRVNLKEKKIYNGTLARVSGDPGKIEVLYSDGKVREVIEMPEDYAAFDYGWVTTSHKSQGRTAENVVVAAESLDRKAFYVALSRGRQEMSLHCPDKEHLKNNLARRTGERVSVHDLIRDREIPANAVLPLSKKARKQKAAILPDFSYKDMVKRTTTALKRVKAMLEDTAMIRRMRKHRERLFDEYTSFEADEPAVGFIDRLMGRISGLFKKAEVVPEEPENAALEQERMTEQAAEQEERRERERKALWNLFDGAWSDYVEKRKEYHACYGGGEAFELTGWEEYYRKQQTLRRLRNEAPEPLPVWLENGRETAEAEARKSREWLVKHLSEEKRWTASWEKADAEWSVRLTERKAYHAELGIKAPFKLWEDETCYQSDLEQRRRNGEYPLAMPGPLTQWKERMDQQKQQELDKLWNITESQWNELISSRKEFYEERHVGSGFRPWPEEETFVQAQEARRASGREPEAIPSELRSWQDHAEEEVRRIIEEQARQREMMLRVLWEDFDRSLQRYVEERSAYQMEFESIPEPYHLSSDEENDIKLLHIQRDSGLVPEYPAWMLTDWKA